jgi:polysaccharide deacetylase 2 family uncharacterized protein YibQ
MVNFNKANLKKNKLAIIIVCLAAFLLIEIAYIFFVKRSDMRNLSEMNGQRIILSLNEGYVNSPGFSDDSSSIAMSIEDDGRPIIALIIGNMGITKSNITKDLPSEVTFGFISNGEFNQDSVAKNNVIVNLPLDKDNNKDSLLADNSRQSDIDKLTAILSKFKNVQGFYISGEGEYTNSPIKTEFLLQQFKDRELLYLSDTRNALVSEIAKKIDFYILTKDVTLDEVMSEEAINNQLEILEKASQERGYAIAMGEANPLTIEQVQKWIPALEKKGIRIVSITDFYKIIQQRKLGLLLDDR